MDNRLITAHDRLWLRSHIKWPVRALLISLALLTVPVVFGILSQTDPTQAITPPIQTPTPFTVAPQVLNMARQLGLNESYLADAKAQIAQPSDCPQLENIKACYDPNTSTLYILPAAFTDGSLEANASLAHEYLHYIYQHVLTPQDHANLTASAQATYNQNVYFRQRMQPYIARGINPGSEEFGNEAFAINCTEMADRELTPSWLATCSHWVPGRAALPSDF